jgi:hypothetical protein
MNRKPRKSLDDSLASEFVFGEPASLPEPLPQVEPPPQMEPSKTETPAPEPTPPRSRESRSNTTSNLMSKLMDMPEREPTVRITVDLPQSMHRKLSLLSAQTGKKKADIVRTLLNEVLTELNE